MFYGSPWQIQTVVKRFERLYSIFYYVLVKLSKIMLGVKSCIQLHRHLSRCNRFHLREEMNVYIVSDVLLLLHLLPLLQQLHLSRCNRFHLKEEINVHKQGDRFLVSAKIIFQLIWCVLLFFQSAWQFLFSKMHSCYLMPRPMFIFSNN